MDTLCCPGSDAAWNGRMPWRGGVGSCRSRSAATRLFSCAQIRLGDRHRRSNRDRHSDWASDEHPRACDIEARRCLGKGQGSRVFPTPTRPALTGSSYVECCTLNAVACGRKISKQAFGILPKILEVDK